jgi:sialic acid synthase SpsE
MLWSTVKAARGLPRYFERSLMLATEFKIAGRLIGADQRPYVIAEAGSNHNQSLDTARQLIDVAAEAGCDAVKFQLFEAGELYPPTHELYKIFKAVELSPDWLLPLQQHAMTRGLAFFASVFDRRSADRLAALDVPAFKIASSETAKLDLLAYVAAKKKPLIVSTGMCDLVDILEAASCCERNGNNEVALLQCVALYPPQPSDANLAVMDTLHSLFGCPVGYSDHVLGTTIAVAAVARGAAVIEKHFTLDRKSPGPDHSYALEPNELADMVRQMREVHAAIGNGVKDMHPEERRRGRREGLYAAKAVALGERFTSDAIAIRQPAIGIRARQLDQLIGLATVRALKEGDPIHWDDVRP